MRSRRELGLPPEISPSSPNDTGPQRTAVTNISLSPPSTMPSHTSSTHFFDTMSSDKSTNPDPNPLDSDPIPSPTFSSNPSELRLSALADLVQNLQQMLQSLQGELTTSRQETLRARNELRDIITAQQTSGNPFSTPLRPSDPTSASSPLPTSADLPKKPSAASILMQSIKNQEQLLQTFVQTMQSSQALQTQQFLTLQQNKLDKAPTKTTFPSFSGKDHTEFIPWETGILNILATHEWSELYDPVQQDIIVSGSAYLQLNNHLYKSRMPYALL